MSGRKHSKIRIIGTTMLLLFIPFITSAETTTFTNPLTNSPSIGGIIVRIIDWLLGISALLAMLSLVIGGITLIFAGFSGGKETEVARGKKIILWSILGLSVVVLSLVILNVMRTILGF